MQALSTAVKTGTAVSLGLNGREKARTMTLFLSPDLHTLFYSYRSAKQKRDLTWRLALKDATVVRAGLPSTVAEAAKGEGGGEGGAPPPPPQAQAQQQQQGFMSRVRGALDAVGIRRAPSAGLGVVLEGVGGCLLHLEAKDAVGQDTVMRALSVLAAYARARAGVVEPLPALAECVAAAAAGGGGGAAAI